MVLKASLLGGRNPQDNHDLFCLSYKTFMLFQGRALADATFILWRYPSIRNVLLGGRGRGRERAKGEILMFLSSLLLHSDYAFSCHIVYAFSPLHTEVIDQHKFCALLIHCCILVKFSNLDFIFYFLRKFELESPGRGG